MDDIKPCPFCGGQADTGHNGDSLKKYGIVRCKNTVCRLYNIHFDLKEWNTRPTLIPLTRCCPECEGSGKTEFMDVKDVDGDPTEVYELESCEHCQGTGSINIYYTPEEYEKTTGKKMLDSDNVWSRMRYYYNGVSHHGWMKSEWVCVKILANHDSVVAINGQPPPPVDYGNRT